MITQGRKEGSEGNLGGAPELEAGGSNGEEKATDDLEVDDAVGRGGRADVRLQRDDLGPSIGHVHLGRPRERSQWERWLGYSDYRRFDT